MIYEGIISGKKRKIAIVWSRFNDFIGSKLLDGAKDALIRHEVSEADIDVYKVPGAFEIPYILQIVKDKNYDAIICLGVIIRGDTPHFEYVASQVSRGVAAISLDSKMPVIFGVLTTDTVDQAVERAGTKGGNKGWQAAVDALEMIDLRNSIK
ncbi:MAG: 6,7-dimethyl-8-ribityllumazine synthase [Candidatus Margulisbacteria bacterium GWF2_35_9]|nr:MAG: 6,7-dimethyl-8-ribityllumazine synthase [Candidatus Margulisbacteria bacterium GWF2_35_9]